MSLTTALFLSLVSCPKYLTELLWVDFLTIFIVIIFCILLNMASLNIAPLAPIYSRATMIGASLYNLENRSQLFIAFDLVSHQKLFAKLHSYGVRGVVLQWLQNFFTGRTLQTKIDSSLSDIADLISGVVQGSAWSWTSHVFDLYQRTFSVYLNSIT